MEEHYERYMPGGGVHETTTLLILTLLSALVIQCVVCVCEFLDMFWSSVLADFLCVFVYCRTSALLCLSNLWVSENKNSFIINTVVS